MNSELGISRHADNQPLWQRRLSTASVFCQALVANNYLTTEQMQRATQRYRLGASRDGGVIFWQIDESGQLRDGKIMHYRPDCHRDHDRRPTWISYLLRKYGKLPEEWKSEHCLFGLHLLPLLSRKGYGSASFARVLGPLGRFACKEWGQGCSALELCSLATRGTQEQSTDQTPSGSPYSGGETVAVVEAEKTAVIMSEVKPEYVWLATGGKTELNVAKLKPLAGHRVILFPDTDADGQTYRDWYEVAEAATDVFGHPVTVSSLLEQNATEEQKSRKIDLVDLLFQSTMRSNRS